MKTTLSSGRLGVLVDEARHHLPPLLVSTAVLLLVELCRTTEGVRFHCQLSEDVQIKDGESKRGCEDPRPNNDGWKCLSCKCNNGTVTLKGCSPKGPGGCALGGKWFKDGYMGSNCEYTEKKHHPPKKFICEKCKCKNSEFKLEDCLEVAKELTVTRVDRRKGGKSIFEGSCTVNNNIYLDGYKARNCVLFTDWDGTSKCSRCSCKKGVYRAQSCRSVLKPVILHSPKAAGED